ncbi:D-alanine aminotransferase [Thalassobacillus devorans]|uniref:D-alanine aminotransferase n=1 Tax=Thalassobacillus devorans TaxID=279813 RepID=A0ABQ1NDQ2_9BACI|nr:D-amino-acid transaminase [Thalassobacillus devorans]NIK26914.1 D-alanine transaminase [Thalassobacillus devorans]GGC73419.1 D-alanine aminotransferase [Thalassobacillus devorans]
MAIKPIILSGKEFVNHDELSYPFEERGLQFGDGVYEVIRVYSGSYYLLNEHVDRLFRSAAAIKIALPFSKNELRELLDQLLEKNMVDMDAKVYLQVTRGSAARDHAFPADVAANFYAYAQELPRNLVAMKSGGSVISHKDLRWDWCYIKSLNLLPNVLAKQEAKESGCVEAILHKDGLVTEGSSSNAYLVRDGKVFTHPAKENILHGCVRMRVEQFCRDLDIPFVEDAFRVEDIQYADEMFISSSTAEITPVIEFDGKKIGNGVPGEVTQKLQHAYEQDAGIPMANSLFESMERQNA